MPEPRPYPDTTSAAQVHEQIKNVDPIYLNFLHKFGCTRFSAPLAKDTWS